MASGRSPFFPLVMTLTATQKRRSKPMKCFKVKLDNGVVLHLCRKHRNELSQAHKVTSTHYAEHCVYCQPQTKPLTQNSTSTLKTELDPDTGLTWVVCTECHRKANAGARLFHRMTCSEFTVGLVMKRKRKIVEITKTNTMQVACEVDEQGNLIIP